MWTCDFVCRHSPPSKIWTNKATINTKQFLPSTFSTGKYVQVVFYHSGRKQQTITEIKSTHYINSVKFQLQTINSSEIKLSENKEKTEEKPLSTDR